MMAQNKKNKLNPMQELFCSEYTVDYNATNAAIRAGYSKKTAAAQGSRLLKDVNVLTRVRAMQSERIERIALTADSVVLKLLDVYDRCMTAVPVTQWDGEERKYIETGKYNFDSRGALKALELLGKHLAMFTQKVEHSGEINNGSNELVEILHQLQNKTSDVK